MNTYFQGAPDARHVQSIQSFHEPALKILNELFERNKRNLRSKGYDEKNAAITKEELAQHMARRFRITHYVAGQVANSLVNSGAVVSFGGYVKPKAVDL